MASVLDSTGPGAEASSAEFRQVATVPAGVVAVVAISTATAALITFDLSARAFVAAFFCAVLVVIAAVDLERGIIPNRIEEYNKLGNLISDARLAGEIDWLAIEDRTREALSVRHWEKPSEIVKASADSYRIDKWSEQDHYVEVWVEKDALAGVLEGICSRLDVTLFPNRGYGSSTAFWEAGQRLIEMINRGKTVHIIHLGDHDPSGIDMSRDIKARLDLFTGSKVHVQRIVLNKPQIDRYNPPPNPAKQTDSRFKTYHQQFGALSWELDALPPNVLGDLVQRAVAQFRDNAKWKDSVEKESRGRKTLKALAEAFPQVIQFLRNQKTV